MSIENVLPTWRFVHTDEMAAESLKFFRFVEGYTLYGDPNET